MSIGGQIRSYRNLKGWSLEELGKRAGLAKSTLSEIENEKHLPSIRGLERIASALGVDMDYLLKK